MKNNILAKYNKINVESDLIDNDFHKVVQKLMQGVIDKTAIAKGLILRKNINEKSKAISNAIDMLYALINGLNFEKGEHIAIDFYRLYDYMIRQLFEANLKNDIGILEEVAKLMRNIKSGWDAIPEDVKKEYNQVIKELNQC